MLHPSDSFWLMPRLWADVVLPEQTALATVSRRMDAFALPLSQTTLEGRSETIQVQRRGEAKQMPAVVARDKETSQGQ